MRLPRERTLILVLCVAVATLALRFAGCGRKAEQEVNRPVVVASAPDSERDEPGEDVATEEEPEATDEEPVEETKPPEEPDPAPEPVKPQEQPIAAAAASAATASAPPKPKPAAVPSVPAEAKQPEPAPKDEGTVVIGTISVASSVPDPSTVPYKNCVTFVKYKVESVESGEYDGSELLAVLWGMKDGKLKPAAKFASGQRHKLKIQPFSEQKELQRMMRADDTDDYSLKPQWVISYSSP